MITLEIEGRVVEVDDSFKNLSPEQQQKEVESIAASFAPSEAPQKIPDAVNPLWPAVGGAATGLVAGPIINKATQGAKQAFQTARIPPAPVSNIPLINPLTEAQLDRALQGTIKEPGITGRASQSTYNTVTQQIAENARKQQQVAQELVRRGMISDVKMPQVVGSTPSGVLVTGREALTAPMEMPPPKPLLAARAMSNIKAVPAAIKGAAQGASMASVMPWISRALTGGATGYEIADMINRGKRGDYTGAGLAGLSALGGALAFIPTPVTRIGGTALSAGSAGLNAYLDSLRKEKASGGLAQYASGGHTTAAWQRKEGQNPEGGLNAAGRASYHAETGGELKRPQPEGGPRRDSFCARMKGAKEKLTSAETARDPDSRINKALRKWNC